MVFTYTKHFNYKLFKLIKLIYLTLNCSVNIKSLFNFYINKVLNKLLYFTLILDFYFMLTSLSHFILYYIYFA